MADLADTLAARGSRYGDFTDNARISQGIQTLMRSEPGWDRLDPVKQEALTVMALKMSRILSGDPNYKDNWHDIAGYAAVAEVRCVE